MDIAGTTTGAAGTIADASGQWELRVTDERNDGETTIATIPAERVDAWSIKFSNVSTTGFGTDQLLKGLTPAKGAATAPYATAGNGTEGVGPSISVAIDNTLGAYSPFEGRIYIAFTAASATNVELASVDGITNGSFATLNAPVQVNDDLASGPTQNDNFSTGSRPEYMPTVAVDDTTGTVGVMYYDGRWDPSLVRVATSFSDSIDGGATFSESVFLNAPNQATDAITGATITIEPVPGNPGPNGAVTGFGDRQGLVMNAGHVVPVFASNDNAPGSVILSATVTIAAGPRIVSSDEGPINSINNGAAAFAVAAASIVSPGLGYAVGDLLQLVGGLFSSPAILRVAQIAAGGGIAAVIVVDPGVYTTQPAAGAMATDNTGTGTGSGATFNPTFSGFPGDTYAPDGTIGLTGFTVQFDRPILISSFADLPGNATNQVTLVYRDTNTPATDPGVTIPASDYTVVPLRHFHAGRQSADGGFYGHGHGFCGPLRRVITLASEFA